MQLPHKIEASNYSNFVHTAKVTITNRPVSVISAVAHQRYPWNGKVDVDFVLTGDAEVTYRVGLSVLDVAGGTNLPVKTVLGETLVAPGRHRLVWDADADIAADGTLPRVKVSVTAEAE